MNNFFGSKLNSALLIILIILMVIALKVMFKDKGTYFPLWDGEQSGQKEEMDRRALLGNADDLVSFSIWPGDKVHGMVSYSGVIKGAYFFEANIVINILDANKKLLKGSYAMATIDWMTSGPVSFEGNIDFSGLPVGAAYLEIHNDNASGLPEYDKSVLVPIVIE